MSIVHVFSIKFSHSSEKSAAYVLIVLAAILNPEFGGSRFYCFKSRLKETFDLYVY